MNVNWFLGFSEGEGNFSVLFGTKRCNGGKYVWAKPAFQLVQAEQKVIKEVAKFLEQQSIKSKVYNNKARSMWRLHVFETESLGIMIKLLDSLEWHTKKRSDFEKWKKCIAIIMEHPDLHRTERKSYSKWRQYICDLLRINHIAQYMNVGRREVSKVWTPEHLINHLKTHEPYKDFDFVKELRSDGKLEKNCKSSDK
jgi:hypothetical protein